MDWYYSKNDVQLGPISLVDLQQKLTSGEVVGSDMVWREGMVDWQPVTNVPELRGLAAPAVMASPPVGYAGGVPLAKKTSGMAVASLVCGLVGFLGLFACGIPGLLGIGGVICGHLALAEIKRSNGAVEGRGLALGGLISGYVSLLLILLFLLFFGAVAILGSKASREMRVEPPKMEFHLDPTI